MFPIADPRGRIVAFGGRGLADDAKPKYINTGETTRLLQGAAALQFRARPRGRAQRAAAHRRRRLYGCDRARGGRVHDGGRAAGHRAHRGPAGAAVAGLARTDPRASTATRPGAAPPSARAGWRCPIWSPGQSLRFVFLPAGEDPDSFLRRQGAEADAGRFWPKPSRSRKCCGIPRPRTAISPRPSAAPGSRHALEALVKSIRDGKVADYYRRDFADRMFKAFKQRQPRRRGPRRDQRQRGGFRSRPVSLRAAAGRRPHGDGPGRRVGRGQAQPARRELAVGRQELTERRLIGLLDLGAPPDRALHRSVGLADAGRPPT